MSQNLEKELIIKKLSESMVYLNLNGTNDQFPINVHYVLKNLIKYNNLIFNLIKENIDNYSEVGLIQILQLLSYRPLDAPKNLYDLVLNKLIEKRKDPTLEFNFELNYDKSLDLSKFKDMDKKDYNKFKLFAEYNININYPIFRGLGFNFYSKDNYFYKEYFLNQNKFIICCKIIEKPIYYVTGHLSKQGVFSNYKYFGCLPTNLDLPKFNSDKDKIIYSIDKILCNLGNLKKLDFDDIDDNCDEVIFSKDVNAELINKMITGTFYFLKSKYL